MSTLVLPHSKLFPICVRGVSNRCSSVFSSSSIPPCATWSRGVSRYVGLCLRPKLFLRLRRYGLSCCLLGVWLSFVFLLRFLDYLFFFVFCCFLGIKNIFPLTDLFWIHQVLSIFDPRMRFACQLFSSLSHHVSGQTNSTLKSSQSVTHLKAR